MPKGDHRTHGLSKTTTWMIWTGIRSRCISPTNRSFKNYGGRGIKVCPRWRDSFANFLADMGERPPGMQIERKDNNGDYEPGNCRWATRIEQAGNRRNNRRITTRGQTLMLAEWSRIGGVKAPTISRRLKRGWTVESAIFSPTQIEKIPKCLR